MTAPRLSPNARWWISQQNKDHRRMDVLLFEVEDPSYALPLSDVDEVVAAVRVTPLPGPPR